MSEMGLYEAMSSTKAVRRLRPDPVDDGVLRRVLTAATWGPSGGNRQAWRIIAVRDPVDHIASIAHYVDQVNIP